MTSTATYLRILAWRMERPLRDAYDINVHFSHRNVLHSRSLLSTFQRVSLQHLERTPPGLQRKNPVIN